MVNLRVRKLSFAFKPVEYTVRIALSILSLGVSVWALPAFATPAQPTNTNGKWEESASRSGKHLEVDLGIDAKDKKDKKGENGNQGVKTGRYEDQGEWNTDRPPLGYGDPGPTVPEPSAAILFGAGLLIAQRAISRRPSRPGDLDN